MLQISTFIYALIYGVVLLAFLLGNLLIHFLIREYSKDYLLKKIIKSIMMCTVITALVFVYPSMTSLTLIFMCSFFFFGMIAPLIAYYILESSQGSHLSNSASYNFLLCGGINLGIIISQMVVEQGFYSLMGWYWAGIVTCSLFVFFAERRMTSS